MKRLIGMLVLTSTVALLLGGCGGGGGGGEGSSNGGGNPPPSTINMSGYVQKGPFLQGGTIQIQGLDNSLNPNGTSFSTVLNDDFGHFSTIISNPVNYYEIIASGYYFDEINNRLSTGPITLRSITENESQQNVNVLTSLARKRIIKLFDSGLPFSQARTSAQNEVASAFLGSYNLTTDFSDMDLSLSGGENPILMACSAIVQEMATIKTGTSGNIDAQLSSLISEMSSDFELYGLLNNQNTIDLMSDAKVMIDQSGVINNLTSKYGISGFTFNGLIPISNLAQHWSKLSLNKNGYFPQVVYDGNNIVTVFGNSSGNILTIATINGTNVAYDNISLINGWYPRVKLDSNKKMHIVYGNNYINNSSGNWVSQPYVSGGIINSVDVAIDANGKMHIVFLDEGGAPNRIRYATNSSGAWVVEDISPTGLNLVDSTINHGVAIDIDNSGGLHIVYNDRGTLTPGLRYVTKSSGVWNIRTLESNPYVGSFADIVYSNGIIHISYRDRTSGALNLKYMNSTDNFSSSKIVSTNCANGVMSVYNDVPQFICQANISGVVYIVGLKTTSYQNSIQAGLNPSIFIDNTGIIYTSYVYSGTNINVATSSTVDQQLIAQ